MAQEPAAATNYPSRFLQWGWRKGRRGKEYCTEYLSEGMTRETPKNQGEMLAKGVNMKVKVMSVEQQV